MIDFVWNVCGLIYKPTSTIYTAAKIAKAPGKHVEERRQIAIWFSKVLSKVGYK